MPELPEVETVVRSLRKTIIGQTIGKIKIKKTARVMPGPLQFKKHLQGAKFVSVDRRGKNILIGLSNDKTVHVHLKMTGHFYYLPISSPTGRHDHVVFDLLDNGNNLRFNDYRRFGRLTVFDSSDITLQKSLVELGPEPLEIACDDFVSLFKSHRRMIKPALLDQKFIAGIGNIYADESLHRARIHPRRLTSSISNRKLKELHGVIQTVLKDAIRLMGSSVDTFTGVNGQPGKYQKYLQVYGREGEKCFSCHGRIRREKISSRSAHYCPKCQAKACQ